MLFWIAIIKVWRTISPVSYSLRPMLVFTYTLNYYTHATSIKKTKPSTLQTITKSHIRTSFLHKHIIGCQRAWAISLWFTAMFPHTSLYLLAYSEHLLKFYWINVEGIHKLLSSKGACFPLIYIEIASDSTLAAAVN